MKLTKGLFVDAALAMALFTVCSSNNDSKLTVPGPDPAKFSTTPNEKPVKLFILKNSNDIEICVTNFGARVVPIYVLNKAGVTTDVVLGYNNIAQYADSVNNADDFGTATDRYANRVNQGQITAAGRKIQLSRNNFGHCLHGSPLGWQYSIYKGNQLNGSTPQLVLRSPDGDNNFPDNVTATVTYIVTSDNTLGVEFEATTDAETVISMANYSYLNLSGDPSKAGTDMVLYVNVDNCTSCDDTSMTTGEIKPVYGTPVDLTKRHTLYETIGDATFTQLKYGGRCDHNYVLNIYKDGKGNGARVAASLYSPESSIYMEVYTSEPDIQVYSGNFLSGNVTGKEGITYPQRTSICLGTQKFPGPPNEEDWPSPYLKPGEKYFSHAAYKFSVK